MKNVASCKMHENRMHRQCLIRMNNRMHKRIGCRAGSIFVCIIDFCLCNATLLGRWPRKAQLIAGLLAAGLLAAGLLPGLLVCLLLACWLAGCWLASFTYFSCDICEIVLNTNWFVLFFLWYLWYFNQKQHVLPIFPVIFVILEGFPKLLEALCKQSGGELPKQASS